MENIYQIGVVEHLMRLKLSPDLVRDIMDSVLVPWNITERIEEVLEIEPGSRNFSIGDKDAVIDVLLLEKTKWPDAIILVNLANIKAAVDELVRSTTVDF